MSELTGIITYGGVFLTVALIGAIASLALNLQWGQTGLFNVGVAGFIGIGAYVSALLSTTQTEGHWGGYHWPIAAACVGAMLAAAVAAALVGFVTLRLRSDYFAITTFGLAVVVQLILRNAQPLTGGSFGIGFIPRPFETLADRPLWFGLVNLALVGAVVFVLYVALEALARSPWGRVLRAIREDERAARALGKSASRYRLQAFTMGGAIMGLAGALQAHLIGFIAPDNFESGLTFQIWTMLIIGGSGNNRGVLLGAVLVSALWSATGLAMGALFPPQHQAQAAALRIIAVGVLLATTLVLRPRGLIGERVSVSRHVMEG